MLIEVVDILTRDDVDLVVPLAVKLIEPGQLRHLLRTERREIL